MYVDSLGNVASEDAKENWENETTYQLRSEEAQAALANMKDNTAVQERLQQLRHEAKAKYEAEVQENAAYNPKQQQETL
jgi:hypothetical protein